MSVSKKSELLAALAKLLAVSVADCLLAQAQDKDSEKSTDNPKKDGGK